MIANTNSRRRPLLRAVFRVRYERADAFQIFSHLQHKLRGFWMRTRVVDDSNYDTPQPSRSRSLALWPHATGSSQAPRPEAVSGPRSAHDIDRAATLKHGTMPGTTTLPFWLPCAYDCVHRCDRLVQDPWPAAKPTKGTISNAHVGSTPFNCCTD